MSSPGQEPSGEEPTAGYVAHRQRTRQRLLRAAVALADAGKPVTVEDTAAAAEVSRATVYRYFATVELLQLETALTGTLGSVDGPVSAVAEICARIDDHGDRVEAVIRCMGEWAWESQPALRVTMRSSLDGTYRRPGYRRDWIALIVDRAGDDLTLAAAEQLRRALLPLFGLDPLLSLVDLIHLDKDEVLDTLAFSARALMTAALQQSAQNAPRIRPGHDRAAEQGERCASAPE